MSMTPGASLDAAIAGITRGVDNARKVATEVNKDSGGAASNNKSSSGSKSSSSSSRVGGSVDVTV